MNNRYRVKAGANRSAEVFIYGDIGESWFGESVSASLFVREIAALDVDTLAVRVNSYGGSVADGLAIYNAVKRHPAKTTVYIDGIAASIASLIAMAGDEIEMAENALMMIHAPWASVSGNSQELRSVAELLDSYAAAMATSYTAKTQGSADEMLALLTDGDDHWFSAQEAQAAGYVDRVGQALAITARFDLSRFKSIPAAAAAFTQEPSNMGNPTTPAAPNPPVQAAGTNEAEIRNRTLVEDAARRAAIGSAFARFNARPGVQALMQACQDDHSVTAQVANDRLLAHLAKDVTSAAGGYVVTVSDETDKARKGVTNALLARAGLAKDDTGNSFRGHTLYDMARASLARAGRASDGLGKMDLVALAFTHSTSDFPLLLANIAEKAMLMGYEQAEETFQAWTSKGSLPDFKSARRVDLNTFPALLRVTEGAEYKSASVGERGETVQLATYGRMFSITRQAIINDDLDAFTKIPRLMGRAAIRTVGDLVYAVLTGNPTMSDSVALFHANHGNLLTGATPNTTSIDAMRVAMARQTDGTAVALNLRLANLIVPVALQGTATVVRDSEFEVGASAKNNTVPNSVRGTFEVIADARLDVASSTAWYGTANKGLHDTIEVSYLDGVETPTLEQQAGWSIDGVEFKVRMDAAVKALDWRSMARNPG